MLDSFPMRFPPRTCLMLVVFSALLQTVIFPVAGPVSSLRSALSLIALVPLLLALLGTGLARPMTPRQAALLGYLCGILWYAGNCSWIYQTMYLYGGLPKPVAAAVLILFSLYLGLYHALFAWLLALVARSRFGLVGACLAVPFLWVAVELARGQITGFPWDLLGYTQVDNSLLSSIAPFAGVMGISFALATANASLTAWIALKGKNRLPPAAAFLVLMAMEVAGFAHRRPAVTGKFRAISLQENLAVGVTGVRPATVEQELSDFSERTLSAATKGDGVPVALVVWPEAPAHLETSDPVFLHGASKLAGTLHVSLILGSLGVDFDRSVPRGYKLFDSALWVSPDGSISGRYDKIHLVPWGEYVPFKEFFSFAQKLTEGVGDMDRGGLRTIFRTDGRSYGTFICYESIFGDEVRQFAANGAEVLVNISDDGWYGDTGAPWQHLNMARMRAIENHRWLVRSTNTGVTTAIDPWGRLVGQAPRHVRAAFSLPFDFVQQTTFYTRHGDWLAWLSGAVSALLAGAGLIARRSS